jgi:hypothetical protein
MKHANPDWPALALRDWEPTYLTLHRFTQVVGKIRLAHSVWLNHWWQIVLYVNSQGLVAPLQCGNRQVTLTFDFVAHKLVADTSDGQSGSFALAPMTVAEFTRRTLALMDEIGAPTTIWPVPVEVADTTPLTEDTEHAAYDRASVESLHRILMSANRVFQIHRGRFLGKSSPVHFFWGAFDLAVTRFSGRRNPDPPKDFVMREAYSHEVISHGFWPGGDWPAGGRMEEAVFYAYSSPEPDGFKTARVKPKEAAYSETFGEFLLPYDSVRTAPDPEAMLLDFMESTYLAAAERAKWNVAELQHPLPARPRSHVLE